MYEVLMSTLKGAAVLGSILAIFAGLMFLIMTYANIVMPLLLLIVFLFSCYTIGDMM